MSPAGQLPEKETDRIAKRSWGRHASRIATGVVLILFVIYAVNDREAFSDLLRVSWTTLVLVAIGRLLIFFSNGMFVKWTAEAFTRRLSMGEGIYVGILSAVGNFFGPLLGGAGIRAVYLRRVHDLPYTYFTSTLMVYYVILFAINFALAIAGLWTLDLDQNASRLLALFGSGLLLVLLSAFIRLPHRFRADKARRSKLANRLVRYLIDIEDGWRRLLGMPGLLIRLVGLAALSVVAQFLIASVSFDSIGAEISWAALAVYVSIVTISLLVAVTPGAIGIREAMLLLISETLGVTGTDILQVAVIDRGVTFALLLAIFVLTRNARLRSKLTSRDLPV
jgi:uncharacterized membrane protein YbhN (UPF0104 family)